MKITTLIILFALSTAMKPIDKTTYNTHLNTDEMENCLNEENFELAFRYVQWKKQTSKKLSKNHLVLFENGYEVEAEEDKDTGRRIIFSKDNSKYFSVDLKEKFIPYGKDTDFNKFDEYFCKLVARAKLANIPKNYLYKYIDGNNNLWIVKENEIEYKPITKEQSSSGEYSGGKPFKVSITLEQYGELQILFKNALQQTSSHSEKREMGTGTVLQFVTETFGVADFYLKMGSAEKKEIEDRLEKFKD